MKQARDSAYVNNTVQTTDQSGTDADARGQSWRDYERVPTDGQACILDREGTIVWTNASWHRNGSPLPIPLEVGCNYGATCQESRSSILNSAMLESALDGLLDSSTEHFDVEVHCVSKDHSPSGSGADHHCLVRGQAFPGEGGRRVILFHEDVTESRLANAELHASEERYREFFAAAPDAVFLLSGSPEDLGRILDANNKAAEDHGYTRDELLGMSIGDLDVDEDAALVKQRVATLLEQGSLSFPARHRRRDGSEFPVEVSARVATIGGKPCLISFNRDVSERQEYENALRENKLQIDLAARASQVGFWHWNLCDNSVMFSPEWKAQIGYEPHEIEDNFEEWRCRVHPDDLDSAMRAVNNHIDGVTAEYTTEFRFQHKDGSYRWIFVRGAISRDDHGEPLRFVGCHIDITPNKRAEEERELLTQRLSQLQRIEAMGTLAGGIAHDFNNILGIISGNVELAMLEASAPAITESLGEILKAGDRAGSLVRQILSFSREESPERQHVELEPIVEDALRLLRATIPQRIQISSQIETDCAFAFVDPEQIHQVLVNLGANACHAIGAGSGQVTIRLSSGPIPDHLLPDSDSPTTGDYAILEVTDNGVGMTEDLQSRIFDPFFTTKETGQGTGLGLSVVHGVVAAHGGAIDVQSKPRKGTTFRVYLPSSSSNGQEGRAANSIPSGNGRRILLVDDEPRLLQVLKRGLEAYGFCVTAIEDPRMAIDAIVQAPSDFDALVTDFDMPCMNGIEATQIIRAACPTIPVLLCSGFMDTKTSTEASAAGIERLVAKPIRVKDLAQTICEMLAPAAFSKP